MKGFFFSVYGLQVTANAPIPGLIPHSPTPSVDLQIWFGLKPDLLFESSTLPCRVRYSTPIVKADDAPTLIVSEFLPSGYIQMKYVDGTEFWIDPTGTKVWATWRQPLTVEDTTVYLLGPVLGFVLRLRGSTSIHASSVEVDGRAVAFVGGPGAGKSTTAAALAVRGFPVLAEDVTVLEERGDRFLAHPGHARVYLWPDSARGIQPSQGTLPQLTPNWDKCYLDSSHPGVRFCESTLPLAAIYFLGNRSGDSGAPLIEPVGARESLLKLVANSSANYLLDSAMRAREFGILSRLVERVALRRVVPLANMQDLAALCDAVLIDLHSVSDSRTGQVKERTHGHV